MIFVLRLHAVKVPLLIYRGTPLDDWVTRVAREGHGPPPNPFPSLCSDFVIDDQHPDLCCAEETWKPKL